MAPMLDSLGSIDAQNGEIDASNGRADHTKRSAACYKKPHTRARHPREEAKVMFPSRDFH